MGKLLDWWTGSSTSQVECSIHQYGITSRTIIALSYSVHIQNISRPSWWFQHKRRVKLNCVLYSYLEKNYSCTFSCFWKELEPFLYGFFWQAVLSPEMSQITSVIMFVLSESKCKGVLLVQEFWDLGSHPSLDHKNFLIGHKLPKHWSKLAGLNEMMSTYWH